MALKYFRIFINPT